MTTSAEKLVKQTIKLLSKTQELDYEELKIDAKKVIRLARTYDQELLGLMEELLDLSNVGSQEELGDFSPTCLQMYCRIKEIDDSGSEKSLRARVWKSMEEEFELDTDDDDDEDDEESVVESDEEDENDEESVGESVVQEIVPLVEESPKKTKKQK